MRKTGLVLGMVIPVLFLAGCTTKYSCPEGSEYWESHYDNGNLESQGCFLVDSSIMNGHWIYYFENGGKDMEGDILNDVDQGLRRIYDEGGNNIVIAEGMYKDGVEEGEWTYYYDDGSYLCHDVYANGELTDEGTCVIEGEEDYDIDLADLEGEISDNEDEVIVNENDVEIEAAE